MPRFKVLSRVDAFVDYVAEVEADNPEEAAEAAYDGILYGTPGIVWEKMGVVEFDAVRVVALDEDDQEIEGTARGDFL